MREGKQNHREEGKGRDMRLSLIRILATLTVIWLHVNSTIADNALEFGVSSEQLTFHVISVYLSEWAVIAFMVLTGALLLDPERRYGKNELLRCLRRIVLALLIFGVPFVACRLWLRGEVPGPGLAGKAFLAILTGREVGHYWYLYLLMGVYLLLPLLRGFLRGSSTKTQWYLLAVLFFLGSVWPQIYLETGESMPVAVIAAFPLLPVLAGHLLLNKKTNNPVLLRALAIGILIPCGIWVVMEAISAPYPYASARIGYSSPQVLLICGAIVLLIATFPKKTGSFSKALWSVDRLCFAVYLIHPVFIQIIFKYFGLIPERHPHERIGTILKGETK